MPKPLNPTTTGEFAALPPIEAAPTQKLKISLAVIRVLTYYNRLTNVTSLIAVWWGLWTLIFPGFWQAWPVAMAMDSHVFGHAEWMSWTLFTAGILDYLSNKFGWKYIRYTTTLIELACWSLLSLAVISLRPVFAPAASVYTAFAFLKLMAWTSIYVGIDKGTLPIYRGCGNG